MIDSLIVGRCAPARHEKWAKATLGRLGLLIMLLLPGACSSDDDSRLSKQDFISRANGVCANAKKQYATLGGVPRDLRSFAEVNDRAARITEEALAELRALRPPASDQTTVSAITDKYAELVFFIRQGADAARSGNAEALQERIKRADAANAEADKLAAGYGLIDNCLD